tara:strand:- start:51 stop:371 length:321 start_codon:yes stop_codon:yes gene_type:complete
MKSPWGGGFYKGTEPSGRTHIISWSLGGEPSVFFPGEKIDKDNHVLIKQYLQSRNAALNTIGQLMAKGLVIPSSQGDENYMTEALGEGSAVFGTCDGPLANLNLDC